MKITFTYENLAVNKTLQHEITALDTVKIEGSHISVKFTDDKGRKIHIVTNQPYHLRQEEQTAKPVTQLPAPAAIVPIRPVMEVEGD